MDVIVDQCRQQIVRSRYRVHVAGEMQIDIFHRHNLRVAAAGCTAFDTEAGPQGGLTQANHGFLADPSETVTEPDCSCGLAFAGLGWRDTCDQDQFSVFLFIETRDELARDLRLVASVKNQ